jgi:hypothetical protein
VIEGLAHRGFLNGQGLLSGGSALVKACAQRDLLLDQALLANARLRKPLSLMSELARLVGDPFSMLRQLGLLLACPQVQPSLLVAPAGTSAPGQPEQGNGHERSGDRDAVGRRNPHPSRA